MMKKKRHGARYRQAMAMTLPVHKPEVLALWLDLRSAFGTPEVSWDAAGIFSKNC